jgi:hypothetical protein
MTASTRNRPATVNAAPPTHAVAMPLARTSFEAAPATAVGASRMALPKMVTSTAVPTDAPIIATVCSTASRAMWAR